MAKPTFIIVTGPGGEEMNALVPKSCISQALDDAELTPTEKEQLKTAIGAVRSQVSASSDTLQKRRAKVNAQIKRLENEKSELSVGSADFSNFYRQFIPAISRCPEAAAATAQAHTAIQPAVREAVELDYKILLAKTQEGILLQRIEDTQSALGALDKASHAIS